MFGIVASIVLALMRSVFGLVPGSTSGTSVVTSPLVVRKAGGVAGTDEVQVADDGAKASFTTFGTQFFQFIGSTKVNFTLDTVTRVGILTNGYVLAGNAATDAGFLAWTNGSDVSATRDTGLSRDAAGVVQVNSGTPIAGGGSAGWIQNSAGSKRVTANQTVVTDSTTLANVTDLSWTLAAGRTYSFTGTLLVTTQATSGAKIEFGGGTATATSFNAIAYFNTASGTAAAKVTTLAGTAGSTAAVIAIDIAGTITVNAGGTFIIRLAQNAETGAAESVVVERGSFVFMEDVR